MFGHFFESLRGKLLNGRNDSTAVEIGAGSTSWDSWELDPKFFRDLSQWTIDHPETTLDCVLDKIVAAIDVGKDLIELIPDTPFPARSLVKALSALLKLGVTISRAHADVSCT